MFVSASFWATGFLVGALGIASGQLWLLYLLATGMAIMGFGGGALLASPLQRQLLSFYDADYDASSPARSPTGTPSRCSS
ncbi:MAG TPA: hypothetical protein VGE77_08350 [Nocardioides sp.]